MPAGAESSGEQTEDGGCHGGYLRGTATCMERKPLAGSKTHDEYGENHFGSGSGSCAIAKGISQKESSELSCRTLMRTPSFYSVLVVDPIRLFPLIVLSDRSLHSKLTENTRDVLVGRGDLNSRPPAPKPAGLPFGSPSFSVLVLKINELEKYLVVARCTEMWLRMHGVPRIFPIANKGRRQQRSCQNIESACTINSVPIGVE